MGAAYGTAKSGTGIAAMAVMRPEAIMKSIIPVSMISEERYHNREYDFKVPHQLIISNITILKHRKSAKQFSKASVFQVVMAGIIAIYGVVVAVLIAGQLAPAGVGSDYTLYK